MRTLALLLSLAVPSLALADEVDLSPTSRRNPSQPARLVIRAEGGNEYAPYGYAGGCISYLVDTQSEIELGAGGGFPGLQLGLAFRQLFAEGGLSPVIELFLAGNTRINRGAEPPTVGSVASPAGSSLWTGLGLGFEQRSSFLDVNVAADIVFVSTSFTPHWSVHGGVGFGF